jgi:hypothetical protein
MSLIPAASQEDLYVDKTVPEMIALLGEPTGDGLRVIDEKYTSVEQEPDFSKVFSLAERRAKVTIRVLEWLETSEHIIIWAKKVDDEWIVFGSLNRKRYKLY